MFISGYANTGKQFSIAFIKQLSWEKTQNSLLWHWLKEKFLPVAKSCTRSLARVISVLVLQKDTIQNTDFSRLNCQLKQKKKMGKWSKLVEFWTRKLFQIRACVISARKAKHLDATTMFTYSHANIPLGQSERAYYLSNFIKCNIILNGLSLEESFHISGTVVDSDWCFENNQSWKWWLSPRCVKTSVAVNNSPTQDCNAHSLHFLEII